MAKHDKINNPSDAAKPSSPSVRLNEFIIKILK